MAKAREIPGLRPDMTFSEAAARTVMVRAQELFDHADDVLDVTDTGRVHAMRVASRRLRAVLEIHAACFPEKLHRSVLRDVKALADALGARRDPDVQLAALERFARKVGEGERPGVELFAASVRARQSEGNDVLAAALDDMRERDLAGRIRTLADAAAPPEQTARDADVLEDVSPEAAAPPREAAAAPVPVPGAMLAVVPAGSGGDELEEDEDEEAAAAGGAWPGGWGARA